MGKRERYFRRNGIGKEFHPTIFQAMNPSYIQGVLLHIECLKSKCLTTELNLNVFLIEKICDYISQLIFWVSVLTIQKHAFEEDLWIYSGTPLIRPPLGQNSLVVLTGFGMKLQSFVFNYVMANQQWKALCSCRNCCLPINCCFLFFSLPRYHWYIYD